MSHEILSSIASQPIEVQMILFGSLVGILIAITWDTHNDAAMILIGYSLAITVGQTLTPWAPSYEAFV
ncbi:MAG: hypothetical protein ABEI52_04710, partial [Halobacteriaceae archaeon]